MSKYKLILSGDCQVLGKVARILNGFIKTKYSFSSVTLIVSVDEEALFGTGKTCFRDDDDILVYFIHT